MDPEETGITFIATGGGGNITGANGARVYNLRRFRTFWRTRIRMDVSGENKGRGRWKVWELS